MPQINKKPILEIIMLARDLLIYIYIYIGQIIKSPGILFPFNYIYIYLLEGNNLIRIANAFFSTSGLTYFIQTMYDRSWTLILILNM